MAKSKKPIVDEGIQRIENIKRLVVIAMFSDDVLLDRLVLKGGNAIDLVHRISTRASGDVDFSMEGDFAKEGIDEIKERIENALKKTFDEAGFEAFDIQMKEAPEDLTQDLADFWGGYGVEFKVIERQRSQELNGNIEEIRKYAIRPAAADSPKFSIDISKHEFVKGKEPSEMDGYRIFVYSPEMIVCEKLRAICQQMPEYGPVVKRKRPGGARARDFVDIHTLVTGRRLDMTSEENRQLLRNIFLAKKVPLSLLENIAKHREFHRENFLAVKDTVKPGVKLESFDFYFDFVLKLVSEMIASK